MRASAIKFIGVLFVGLAVVAASNIANATIVERVAIAGTQNSDLATFNFPPDTELSAFKGLSVEAYEGPVRNGLAEGEGVLRLPDSLDFFTRKKLGENYLLAKFVNGLPQKEFTLYLSWFGIKRVFELEGNRLTLSVENRLVAVVTALPDQGKTLVRLLRYTGIIESPSRMFFGELTANGLTGDWVDVPWFHTAKEGVWAGYATAEEFVANDGGSSSCTLTPRLPDPPWSVPTLRGTPGASPVELMLSLVTVQHDGTDLYGSHANRSCTDITPQGWQFDRDVEIVRDPPSFKTRVVETMKSCRTPEGKRGDLKRGGTWCSEHRASKQDVFTNIARESKRFLDRRVLGTINRAGGSVEKAMCRASGTTPGENCHVSFQVGASWPVGDGPSGLTPEEEAIRQSYMAAMERSALVAANLSGENLQEIGGVTAELAAICSALCYSEGQRAYAATLLSHLNSAASRAQNEESLRSIASINREAASLFAGGLRALTVLGAGLAAGIPAYKFVASANQADKILTAMDVVHEQRTNGSLQQLRDQARAMQILAALQTAHLQKMSIEGADVLSSVALLNIKAMRNVPAKRASILAVALQLNKTKEEIDKFVEKYKDVTEDEIYDAIIREALAPLGAEWPPKT